MDGVNGLADAVNSVIGQLRQKFRDANTRESIWQSLQAFAAAVDWKVDVSEVVVLSTTYYIGLRYPLADV